MAPAGRPEHRIWAPGRVVAIAGTTFIELTRLRVFLFLLLFALLLIGSSLFFARLSFQQEFQLLKDISLGAMSLFTSLLAILATARLLPQDVEERTVYTILAKPVPRWEYLAGKLLGVLLLLAVGVLVMGAFFAVVLYVREHSALAEIVRASPAEQLAARAEVRAAAFTAGLLPGIAIIFLKGAVLSALTLLLSTFATSNLFTVVAAVFVYFIGHLQATAREFWLQEQAAGWGARIFLALVALVFPDLQSFDFVDQAVSGAAISLSLFAQTAALAGFYVVVYFLCAIALFSGKEL